MAIFMIVLHGIPQSNDIKFQIYIYECVPESRIGGKGYLLLSFILIARIS